MKIIKQLKLNNLIKIIFLLVFVTSCATQKTGNTNLMAKAKKIDARRQYDMGHKYYCDCGGVEKDYKKAVNWFEKSAEQGYAQAQFQLGSMYYFGEWVEKDYKKAIGLYRKAAEQRHPIAELALGYMYKNGQGVKRDYKKSKKWFGRVLNMSNTNTKEEKL